MILFPHKTPVYYDSDGKEVFFKVGTCEANDTKPTGDDAADIANGSFLTESDTGDVYFYGKTADTWTKMFSFKE